MMKLEEIRALSPEEISEKVLSLKKRLLTMRIERTTGKLEKHGEIRDVRKTIAKLLTVFNEESRKAPAPPKTAPRKSSKKESK